MSWVIMRIECRRKLNLQIIFLVPTAVEAADFPLNLEYRANVRARAEVFKASCQLCQPHYPIAIKDPNTCYLEPPGESSDISLSKFAYLLREACLTVLLSLI